MRVAHFIITRFCVRGGRWLDHVDGLWFKDVNPLRPRNVDLRYHPEGCGGEPA